MGTYVLSLLNSELVLLVFPKIFLVKIYQGLKINCIRGGLECEDSVFYDSIKCFVWDYRFD